MGVKLQTIGDTKRFLENELSHLYPPGERGAVVSLLVESVTGLSQLEQLRDRNNLLGEKETATLHRGLKELLTLKPVQHVTGYAWFMGRRFMVNSDVLIPRQETEELVLNTLRHSGSSFAGTIIDFCTGTGCIAITLACSLPAATLWATDLYPGPLQMAAANATNHSARVKIIKHNLHENDFTGLPRADIIVSNPPYVRNSEKSMMNPQVIDNEPHEALFVPDTDPLLHYRALLGALESLLKPGGWFCFEINEALGPETLKLFTNPAIINPVLTNDINSKNRFISGTRA